MAAFCLLLYFRVLQLQFIYITACGHETLVQQALLLWPWAVGRLAGHGLFPMALWLLISGLPKVARCALK